MGRRVVYEDSDFVKAFQEAVEANNLTYKDIMVICGKPERTAYKLIAGESVPDNGAMMLLHAAIVSGNKIMPRLLNRIAGWISGPAREWGRKHREDSKMQFIGECIQIKKEFIYHGEMMSFADIARAAGIKYQVCRWRIGASEAKPGDDVTDAIDHPRKRGEKRGK